MGWDLGEFGYVSKEQLWGPSFWIVELVSFFPFIEMLDGSGVGSFVCQSAVSELQ